MTKMFADAKTLGKTGKSTDKTRAVQIVKRAQLKEKEFNKLQGQLLMLEQQKDLVETQNFDINVISAI